MSKTVRVRVLVAVDRKGAWVSFGASSETDAVAKEWIATESLEAGEIYHWIEADVPLPTEAGPTIEGEVLADTGQMAESK